MSIDYSVKSVDLKRISEFKTDYVNIIKSMAHLRNVFTKFLEAFGDSLQELKEDRYAQGLLEVANIPAKCINTLKQYDTLIKNNFNIRNKNKSIKEVGIQVDELKEYNQKQDTEVINNSIKQNLGLLDDKISNLQEQMNKLMNSERELSLKPESKGDKHAWLKIAKSNAIQNK